MMKGKDKEKLTIVIGGRSPSEEEPLAEDLNEAEMKDEEMYAAMAPTGSFKAKALNNLVTATNKLLPAFGQTPDYPMFKSDITTFPTDFVRILAMFSDASKDAVDAEAVDPELLISLDDISDDMSATAVAAKLDALSRSKPFKKFLKEPYETKGEESSEALAEGEEEMSEEDMDSLMMGRM
jgi:hypothetical protein